MLSEEQQKQVRLGNNLLEVTANDYWFKTLRPLLDDFNGNYHTDIDFNKTISEVINHCSAYIANEQYSEARSYYQPMMNVITSPDYLKKKMLYASQEEKEAVVEIINKFQDFELILQYEKDKTKEKPENKERLSYSPPDPSGDKMGYNTDDLSNRLYKQLRDTVTNEPKQPEGTKQRIPNKLYDKKYNF